MKTTTVRAALRPRLWIVAGPNGSGKSSAYDRSDVDEFGGSVWIINPDLLTQRITYVYLRSVELRVERIRLRVLKGGHHVPFEKVGARRARSFAQAGWFFDAADEAWIFDNSTSEPELVGRKEPGRIALSAKIPADLMQSLLNPED